MPQDGFSLERKDDILMELDNENKIFISKEIYDFMIAF